MIMKCKSSISNEEIYHCKLFYRTVILYELQIILMPFRKGRKMT